MRASWIALGAAFGLLGWSSGSMAQGPAVEAPAAAVSVAAPTVFQGVVGYGAAGSPVVYSAGAPVVVGEPSIQPHPYSYYVTFPAPARTYVGYGAMDQFPFQGQAYGRPGDRWSWSGMMGNRAAGLDRYYYQLLP